jgi:outer membrane protein OmpA-like peptidoglycan-associated protein
VGAFLASAPAHAQSAPNQGFQLNRYEPTAAGEYSFAVDHPWYSSTRYFAAGVTLNYAHEPLVAGSVDSTGSFSQSQVLIAHQFIAHIDLAGSFLDRILITASLPVVLATIGDSQFGSDASVGDPRVGARVRLYGQPYATGFSASLGFDLWVPLRGFTSSIPPTYSDQAVRVLPKLILGGVKNHFLWSGTFGFLYRPEATTVTPPGFGNPGTAASELQFGLSAQYYNPESRFAIGPEVLIATAALGADSFSRFGTSVEANLGAHYNIAKIIQVGLALGTGFVRQPGTPDFRGLLRIAYAPIRSKESDRDGDGIIDSEDACPDVKGIRTGNPATNGCPPPADRDHDGVPDDQDLCPDVHKGPTPDPQRLGCPLPPAPEPDRDGDGILDKDDMCPDVPKGPTPDPQRLGCPAVDTDKDGLVDPQDMCPTEPMGLHPDPERPGCPLPDRDHDTVPDKVDACPDKPGAPSPDPKKNGCPGLLEVKGGQLVILKPVFFATNKDIILAQSFPVLQAVADALHATPSIKRIRIEGHTDNVGVPVYNVDLSQRRAKSVLRWLVEHGIEESRLESEGYGMTRPIDTNKTPAGRAKNRRVEFHIVDGTGGSTMSPVDAPAPPPQP